MVQMRFSQLVAHCSNILRFMLITPFSASVQHQDSKHPSQLLQVASLKSMHDQMSSALVARDLDITKLRNDLQSAQKPSGLAGHKAETLQDKLREVRC